MLEVAPEDIYQITLNRCGSAAKESHSDVTAVDDRKYGDVDVNVGIRVSDGWRVRLDPQAVEGGRPEVQQTYGVAAHRGRKALVFSLGGFTDEAVEWAGEAGVGLFEFDLQGAPQPFQ